MEINKILKTEIENREEIFYEKGVHRISGKKQVEQVVLLTDKNIYVFTAPTKISMKRSYKEISSLNKASNGLEIIFNKKKSLAFLSSYNDVIADIIGQCYRTMLNEEIKKQHIAILGEKRKSVENQSLDSLKDEKWAEFWRIRFKQPLINNEVFQKFRIAVSNSEYAWLNKVMDSDIIEIIRESVEKDPSLLREFLWTLRTIINEDEVFGKVTKDAKLLKFLCEKLNTKKRIITLDLLQLFCYIGSESKEGAIELAKIMLEDEKTAFYRIYQHFKINIDYLDLNKHFIILLNVLFISITNQEKRIKIRSQMKDQVFETYIKELEEWSSQNAYENVKIEELFNQVKFYNKQKMRDMESSYITLLNKANEYEDMIKLYKEKLEEKDRIILEREHLLASYKDIQVPQSDLENVSNPESASAVPRIPSVPSVPGVPKVPSISSMPGAPKLPSIPSVPGTPKVPRTPLVPSVPGAPKVPGLASVSSILCAPKIPQQPTYKLPNLKKWETQKKVKQVFWTKLKPELIEKTIWWDLAERNSKLNMQEIENYFTINEAQRRETRKPQLEEKNAKKTSKEKVFIFAGPKEQQMQIFLKNISFLVGRSGIKESPGVFLRNQFSNLNFEYINPDLVSKTLAALPDANESKQLEGYRNNKSVLGLGEQFMLELTEFKELPNLLSLLTFKNDFETQFSVIKKNVETICNAYAQISTSNGLKLFLSILLNFGNICNSKYKARVNTYGFEVEFLEKLGGFENKDKSMSLLEYIYSHLLKEYPDEEIFVHELSAVTSAQVIDPQFLKKSLSYYKNGINKYTKIFGSKQI